jgi:hypothetical protein
VTRLRLKWLVALAWVLETQLFWAVNILVGLALRALVLQAQARATLLLVVLGPELVQMPQLLLSKVSLELRLWQTLARTTKLVQVWRAQWLPTYKSPMQILMLLKQAAVVELAQL